MSIDFLLVISSVNVILPTLLLISMGFGLRRLKFLEAGFWTGLEKIVYYVFFPILLASTTIRANLSLQHLTLMLTAAGIIIIGIAFSWLGFVLSRAPSATRRAVFQCGFRFNAYIGIAVVSVAHGQAGVEIFALMIAVCVPMANFASVLMLSGQKKTRFWQELIKNPLIIGTLIGVLGNLLGITLPIFLTESFNLISNAAIVIGLISVGAALCLESFAYFRWLNSYFITLKLMLLPFFTLLLLIYLAPPLNNITYSTIMVFASLPSASSAYVLAVRMGGDGKVVALQTTFGSIVSMLTIPFWLIVTQQVFTR